VVVDAATHRIVQESITNVLRHSGSTEAVVEVDTGPMRCGCGSPIGAGGPRGARPTPVKMSLKAFSGRRFRHHRDA
jgi:hypothetical protein